MKMPTYKSALTRVMSLLSEHLPECPALTTENVDTVLRDFLLRVAPPAGLSNVVPLPAAPTPHVVPSNPHPPPAASAPQTAVELIDTLPFKATSDQREAWVKLVAWIADVHSTSRYFVLGGGAGTGKTSLMQLLPKLDTCSFVFTAPTNKATRVLTTVLGQPAATTYSALKLRLVEDFDSDDGPRIESTGVKLPYDYTTVLVVDETSMVNVDLLEHLENAAARYSLRILFVGDPAQLPPVKEMLSQAWRVTSDRNCRAFLNTVCRFDNHILTLCADIRARIRAKSDDTSFPDLEGLGVERLRNNAFLERALQGATPSTFLNRKIIAWRNVRVNEYNDAVRERLGFSEPYQADDILMFASPLSSQGAIVASVDDEVRVKAVNESTLTVRIPKALRPEFIDVYALAVEGDFNGVLNVPQSRSHFDEVMGRWVNAIRKTPPRERGAAWEDFYKFKGSVAKMRYAYAITAHRAQGSTLDEVFVDMTDILTNRDTPTALRCLYVAFSRPRHSLFVT